MNPFQLNDERIVVSGASSGIGAATASAAAEAGAKVLLLGRDRERLEAVKAALAGTGHLATAGDLTATGEEWLPEALAGFGGLTGLVHCAGVRVTEPVRFLKETTWDKTMAVNLKAAFDLIRLGRKLRDKQRPFSAVFISSVAACGGAPGLSGYSASKGALESAVRAWAVELASENIRVNAVAPGYVEGAMLANYRAGAPEAAVAALAARYPLGFGRPRDVALAVQYLLSPAARWVTGSVLTVDGGFSAA